MINQYQIFLKIKKNKTGLPFMSAQKPKSQMRLKRNQNISEVGYLNIPKPTKANKVKNVDLEKMFEERKKLENEMIKNSFAVGGALTQVKRRKKRLMLKEMMEHTDGNINRLGSVDYIKGSTKYPTISTNFY